MMPNTLNIIGLAANLLGTIIATFSGGLYLRLLDTSIGAIEVTLHSLLSKTTGVPVFTGLDQHREKESSRSKRWVLLGIFLVVLGFALQLIALIIT